MNYTHTLTLSDRIAVVTGGSGSIGLAIAKKFAMSGMKIALLTKSAESADTAARALGTPSAIGYGCDISDSSAVQAALAAIAEHFGGIDVLVNSAGILDQTSVAEITPEYWDEIMSVNLSGTFFTCQHAIPHLRASAAPRIINISSNAGRMGGFENGLAYTASKGGVISLTYGLARHLAPIGITVNCIAPGTIDSDMLRQWDKKTQQRLLQRFPLGRFGRSSEVAAAACYFASEEAAFTTGAVLDVNGGLFMG